MVHIALTESRQPFPLHSLLSLRQLTLSPLVDACAAHDTDLNMTPEDCAELPVGSRLSVPRGGIFEVLNNDPGAQVLDVVATRRADRQFTYKGLVGASRVVLTVLESQYVAKAGDVMSGVLELASVVLKDPAAVQGSEVRQLPDMSLQVTAVEVGLRGMGNAPLLKLYSGDETAWMSLGVNAAGDLEAVSSGGRTTVVARA